MKRHLIVSGIVVLLICVGLSGCTDKSEAERRGEDYLYDKYVALSSGYAENLKTSIREVSPNMWSVSIRGNIYSSGIWQYESWSCYVWNVDGTWKIQENEFHIGTTVQDLPLYHKGTYYNKMTPKFKINSSMEGKKVRFNTTVNVIDNGQNFHFSLYTVNDKFIGWVDTIEIPSYKDNIQEESSITYDIVLINPKYPLIDGEIKYGEYYIKCLIFNEENSWEINIDYMD